MRIIGFGKVVQRFLRLRDTLENPPAVEVYTRKPPEDILCYQNVSFDDIENYRPDARHITIVCCSANEQQILSAAGMDSRLQVAKANLAIVSALIDKGYFREEMVFVVTNPSEVIAEFIWQKTHNKAIFALGLSHDFRRYQKIFFRLGVSERNISAFGLDGNHWDFPVAVLGEHSALHQELRNIFGCGDMDFLVHRLHSLLIEEIHREFLGFKPPIESGAQALMDVSRAHNLNQSILLSGPDSVTGTFVAGTLHFMSGAALFKQASSGSVQQIVDRVRLRHQKVAVELFP